MEPLAGASGVDLLGLYFGRGDSYREFWQFYATVSMGAIAFVGAAADRVSRGSSLLFAAAFASFAISNLLAMLDADGARRNIYRLLGPDLQEIAAKSPDKKRVIAFHLFCDAFVVATIVVLPRL